LGLAPDDLVARRDESNGYSNLAVALYAAQEFDEAARHIAKSLAFDEEMLRADSKNSQVQRDLSWDLGFLAELAAAQGQFEQAVAYQRRSHRLYEARAEGSPDSFQARKDLAESWSLMSDLLNRSDQFKEALQASSQSLALFEALRRENPNQTRLLQLMALQYARHAELLEATRSGRREVCLAYESSLGLWRELSSKGAAIDAENSERSAEMEKAVARCGREATVR
jgi:tetratricopeptide (TPR) repeat protein